MPEALALPVAGYLIGSVSFAVVVSRIMGLPDPHGYGSGNPGATNVLRTGNRLAAALTLAGDAAKGFVAVLLARHFTAGSEAASWAVPATALAAFVGHLYPVFHRFAGGKGVSTAAGIVVALSGTLFFALAGVWAAMAVGFRISSLAALSAAAVMPIGAFLVFGNTATAWALVPIAALLFVRHRENLRKLLAGTERRIGH